MSADMGRDVRHLHPVDIIVPLTWIGFIKRLKDTGMPIKEIRHYAELRAAGDSTLPERMEMLVQHRQALNEQIEQLQEHQIKLDEKIEFYSNEIERVSNTNGSRVSQSRLEH